MTVREADKAGSWYAAAPAALRGEVDACVARGRRLHGAFDPVPGKKTVAVVVPHAGLFFSGAVAAVAYDLLRRAWKKIDTFVLFGACHVAQLREPAIWAEGVWECPLGGVAVDESLAARFLAEGIGSSRPEIHLGDNALELQLPFIRRLFPEAKILPVALSPSPDSAAVGARASAIAREAGGDIVAVASTDLTHYGAAFGLMPAGAGSAAVEWTKENDGRFLDALTGLELERIVPVAARDGSACGAGAAAAAAGWAAERGCGGGRLLARTSSYEVAPQGRADHIVGYASVAFDAPL